MTLIFRHEMVILKRKYRAMLNHVTNPTEEKQPIKIKEELPN